LKPLKGKEKDDAWELYQNLSSFVYTLTTGFVIIFNKKPPSSLDTLDDFVNCGVTLDTYSLFWKNELVPPSLNAEETMLAEDLQMKMLNQYEVNV
jgi:hypothetical protein